MSWIDGTTKKARMKTYVNLDKMNHDDWLTSIGERIVEQRENGPRDDIANYKIIRKKLKKLRKSGKIKRITKTIYVRVTNKN